MAAVAFLEFRERRENAYSRPDGPHRLNTELFQFSYNADIDDLSDRFREWLEESVLTGLDFWRQRL